MVWVSDPPFAMVVVWSGSPAILFDVSVVDATFQEMSPFWDSRLRVNQVARTTAAMSATERPRMMSLIFLTDSDVLRLAIGEFPLSLMW